MSIADHEIEPIDEEEGYCSIHDRYYVWAERCPICANAEADRRYDDMRETNP